jgi:hypothetical protein
MISLLTCDNDFHMALHFLLVIRCQFLAFISNVSLCIATVIIIKSCSRINPHISERYVQTLRLSWTQQNNEHMNITRKNFLFKLQPRNDCISSQLSDTFTRGAENVFREIQHVISLTDKHVHKDAGRGGGGCEKCDSRLQCAADEFLRRQQEMNKQGS